MTSPFSHLPEEILLCEILRKLDPPSALSFALSCAAHARAFQLFQPSLVPGPPPAPSPSPSHPRPFLLSFPHTTPIIWDAESWKFGSESFVYACAVVAKSREFLLWAERVQNKPLNHMQVNSPPPLPLWAAYPEAKESS